MQVCHCLGHARSECGELGSGGGRKGETEKGESSWGVGVESRSLKVRMGGCYWPKGKVFVVVFNFYLFGCNRS